MITEPDVTLTDYGLVAECALFSYVLYPRGDQVPSSQTWSVLFFGGVGVAALLGGTVHGFFLDETPLGAARGFVGETASG